MKTEIKITDGAVRVAEAEDRSAILGVAQATGMFDPEHATDLADMLDAWLAGAMPDHIWIVRQGGEQGVHAVAYVMPEAMTNGTWNLQFIAVDPKRQGEGCGSDLLAWIENGLSQRRARLLIVETSSLEGYKTARTFYCARRFIEEARIGQFYAEGEDKVVFTKVLKG